MYLDASILVRILLKDGPLLADWQSFAPYTSRLAIVELKRVLDRLRLNGDVNDVELTDLSGRARSLEAGLQVLPLLDQVLERASHSFGVVVGTLDAIHLATAAILRTREVPDLVFATHDRQQARGAEMLGFDVIGVDF